MAAGGIRVCLLGVTGGSIHLDHASSPSSFPIPKTWPSAFAAKGCHIAPPVILPVSCRSAPSVFALKGDVVGTETSETEPITGVEFQTSIKAPGSSSVLSLCGTGYREKNIAFIRVKVYAIGMYFDNNISTFLTFWKGRNQDLSNDPEFFKAVIEAPVDKGIIIVLVRDVDGATFWGALDEALGPRLKGGKASDKVALDAFGEVFRGRPLKQGTAIYLTWVQPSCLQVAMSAGTVVPETVEASINSAALVSSLFDVYLGKSSVSPSAKQSTALGLASLL